MGPLDSREPVSAQQCLRSPGRSLGPTPVSGGSSWPGLRAPSGFSHGFAALLLRPFLLLTAPPTLCAHQAGAESQAGAGRGRGGWPSGRLLCLHAGHHTDTWMSRATADGRGLPGQGCPPRAGDKTLEGGVVGGGQREGSGEQTVLGAPWAVGGRLAGWPLTPAPSTERRRHPARLRAHLLARGAQWPSGGAPSRPPSRPHGSPLRGDHLLGCLGRPVAGQLPTCWDRSDGGKQPAEGQAPEQVP